MHAAPWINIHAEDSQLYLLVVTGSAVLSVPPNIFSSVYIICVNSTRPSPCKQTGLLNKQLSILDVATPGSNFYKSKIKILPLTDHFLKADKRLQNHKYFSCPYVHVSLFCFDQELCMAEGAPLPSPGVPAPSLEY